MDVIIDYWLRFGINLAIISLLIAALYWRRKPSRNNALAMIVGGALVYAVIRLLVHIRDQLGRRLWHLCRLFSCYVFARWRFRCANMTYLFATITLSLGVTPC